MTALDETVAILQALDGPYSVDDLPRNIAARIVINLSTGCWEADYAPNPNGYALAQWRGKRTQVHRLVYTLLVGPIPDGLQIDHVKARGCRSKKCCNPAHLEPVTGLENVRRALKSECKRGHPFDEANTRLTPTGRRVCRQCAEQQHRASLERRAASEGRVVGIAGRDKTHCKNGHEFTPENTIKRTRNNGRELRECRECHRKRNREYVRTQKSRNGLHRQPCVHVARHLLSALTSRTVGHARPERNTAVPR